MKEMKKLAYILLIALSATFASCGEDFLEAETQSAFDESVVFSNYTLAEYNVFSISETFGHTNNYRGRFLPWYGFNTDAEWYVSTTQDAKSEIATYAITVNNSQLDLDNGPYNEIYAGIERANICIKGLRTYGDVENKTDMAYLLGEALTLRAFLYYELLKAFGDVPARFEPITSETIYLPKTDRDVIYKQILDDLDEAENYLPWPATTAATMTTDRVNKAFANGLYARIALAASGYALRPEEGMVGTGDAGSIRLSNDPELSKAVLYPKVLDKLQAVINSGSASLYTDYEQYWRDFNNFDLTAGKETLFVIPFSDSRGRWNYTFAIRSSINGSSRAGTVGPAPTLYFDYNKNDQRRNLSCVNFKYEKDGVVEPANIENWYFGKYRFQWMEKLPYTGGNDDGIKPIVMRYSDILLMAAEVANELNLLDEAKGYFKEVRQRATGAEAETYVAGLSEKTLMFEAIVKERKLEFVGEFLRKGDLIRWNMLKDKLDESIQNYRDLKSLSGNYAFLNPEGDVWYREVGGELEFYGFDGERVAPDGDEWIKKGGYITKDSDGQTEERASTIYTANPNQHMYWPIFQSTLTNSQGALVNDFGY